MPPARHRLSAKAATILTAIGKGHTYEQILAMDRSLTYLDIFAAAHEALALPERPVSADAAGLSTAPLTFRQVVEEHRRVHPRAYEPWDAEEEARLIELVRTGHGTDDIAATLQRKPSAIRSRMDKLQLAPEPARMPEDGSTAGPPRAEG